MSVQTTYEDNQVVGFEGALAATMELKLRSGKASQKIDFGRGLVLFEDGYKPVAADKVTFDTDFSASNVITGKVSVTSVDADGVETEVVTSLSRTYASSHASTLAGLVSDIEAITGIDATGTASSGRTITVKGSSGKIVKLYDFAIAGGSAVNVTYDITQTFQGVSVQDNKEPDSNGDVYYKPLEALNIANRNDIYVKVDGAVNAYDTVYLRIVADSGTNQKLGQFTTSTNAAKAVSLAGKAQFMESTSGAGLVRLGLLVV